jgi:hypothetical protein
MTELKAPLKRILRVVLYVLVICALSYVAINWGVKLGRWFYLRGGSPRAGMDRHEWADTPPRGRRGDGFGDRPDVVGGASVRPDSAVVRTAEATVPTQRRAAVEALIYNTLRLLVARENHH